MVEIHKLDISHNNIAAISDRLGDIGSLTFLNLSHNQLTFLPPAIGKYVLNRSMVFLTALKPRKWWTFSLCGPAGPAV